MQYVLISYIFIYSHVYFSPNLPIYPSPFPPDNRKFVFCIYDVYFIQKIISHSTGYEVVSLCSFDLQFPSN